MLAINRPWYKLIFDAMARFGNFKLAFLLRPFTFMPIAIGIYDKRKIYRIVVKPGTVAIELRTSSCLIAKISRCFSLDETLYVRMYNMYMTQFCRHPHHSKRIAKK